MPKKKKDKQKISSSAAVIAPVEQTTALQRKYHFEDLKSEIIQMISKDHIETFNQLLTEINQSSDLSPRLQNKVRAMIAEFEKTLGLFYTDEKLKNFDAIFNDTDYFKTSYFNKLGTLYLKLNQKDKAKAYLHRSLLECRHPILIQNLALMLAEGLIQVGEEDYFTYLWHVILCHDLVRGTSHTRAMIEKMYEYFQAGSKVQALEVFSNKLYNHYLKNNNHEAVAELINFLSKSSSDFLKSCAANLLKAYITFYMSSSNFDQIDKLLVEFQTLVSSEHYKVITTFITHQLVLNKLSQKLLIKYLQKNVELGDIQAHMSLALILIEEPTSANEDPERGLKLVKNVQLLLKSKKGEEFDRIRGYCFYLIGKIYDRGLLPNHPQYKQNDSLAIENYLKAIQYKNGLACHDLAVIYQDGKGIDQDLEKAIALLKQAEAFQSGTPVRMSIATVQLKQLSKTSDLELRNKLQLAAIESMEQILSDELQMAYTSKGDAYFFTAFTYLFRDFNLTYKCSQKSIVEPVLSLNPFYAPPINGATHAAAVHAHLLQSHAEGNPYSKIFLGILLHHGTYLKKDLDKAEQYYQACINEGIAVPTVGKQLMELYLLKMSLAQTQADKEDCLLKALRWNAILLKLENGFKEMLTDTFTKLLSAYRAHDYTLKELTELRLAYKEQRLSSELQFDSNKNKLGLQLNQAIEAVIPNLEKAGDGSPIALLKSFYEVSLILKKSKSALPSYIRELNRLSTLEIPLPLFAGLPFQAQTALINDYSNWPVIHDAEGFLSKLLVLIQTKNLADTEKVALALALTRLKHQTGLFEAELIRLFFNELGNIKIQNIVTAAQLLYLLAALQANGSDALIRDYVRPAISRHFECVIKYLKIHCWEADPISMSQIYHALNYLRFAYPNELAALPESLIEFMQFHEKILAKNEVVTISKQQQAVYDLLSTLSPYFKHEPLVGGRRVDYYNPQTKEVVFFDGPSHYLYKEGSWTENAATVLNKKTLEIQGFTVISIPFFLWNDTPIPDRAARLKEIIPSLRPLLETDPEKVATGRFYSTIEPGKSSPAFWQGFSLQKGIDFSESKTNRFE